MGLAEQEVPWRKEANGVQETAVSCWQPAQQLPHGSLVSEDSLGSPSVLPRTTHRVSGQGLVDWFS